ncbi:MAG: cytochrome c oxidase assembly factor Coa1 family protein [Steroidobacterales bacterium]
MLDGQVDYSNFTRRQLYDALRHIDGARFPLNLANLERALEVMKDRPGADDEAPRPLSARAKKWIVVGAVVLGLMIAAAVTLTSVSKKRLLAEQTQLTYQYIAKNAAALAALGSPIASSDFSTQPAPEGAVRIKMKAKGPKAGGTITGKIAKSGKDWKFMSFRLVIAGQYDSIELSTETQ